MRGSPTASPANAPMAVAAFHSTKTASPVVAKPRRAASVEPRVTPMAVDSSIRMWAAPARRQPRHCSSGAIRSP